MKKVILASVILTSLFAFSTSKTEYVYICKGPKSKVYHKSEFCRGLSNCSTQVYKVTIEESEQMGRRPCRIEY